MHLIFPRFFFSCHNKKMSFNSCVISLLGFHIFFLKTPQQEQKKRTKKIQDSTWETTVAERKFNLLFFYSPCFAPINKIHFLLRTRWKKRGIGRKGKNASTSIATFERTNKTPKFDIICFWFDMNRIHLNILCIAVKHIIV